MNKSLVLLFSFCLTFLFGCEQITQPSPTIFIAPDGNDNFSGRDVDQPLQTLAKALELAQAGDTIYLHPGTYPGRNLIRDKHGAINQPIVIMSLSDDPMEFAIIDSESEPALNVKNEGFRLENCSWLNLERLVFHNCWTNVIEVHESNYISIKSCHFTTGKRIIHAVGHKTHHVLVEDCYAQHPSTVWKGWSWETLHHGDVSYYNGALLHPNKSGGGHIMRGCSLLNVYNAFRTRPVSIKEDGNTEVYKNFMKNIRDNEFEPETWAWNMHYSYNRHINIHKSYSIDGVRGGNIYIFGNTFTQTTDPWAMSEVSGIFKYSAYDKGELTYPCYAFNNSYYTAANVLRWGESTNHMLKHFNNAYHFFEGQRNFKLTEWQPGFEFDFDVINQDWPEYIRQHKQEKHGKINTLPGFADGFSGAFHLQTGSPCVDAGKKMILPEFDWEQEYEGNGPDVGAYEGRKLTDGPPFRFIPSPEGAFYEELPRVSKFSIEKYILRLYFSSPLDSSTVEASDFRIYDDGELAAITDFQFPPNPYELIIELNRKPEADKISMQFSGEIMGQNGQPLTSWGSAIPIGKHVNPKPKLSKVPLPAYLEIPIPDIFKDYENMEFLPNAKTDTLEVAINLKKAPDMNFVNILHILNSDGEKLMNVYEPRLDEAQIIFKVPSHDLKAGTYAARISLGNTTVKEQFVLN